MDIVHRPVMLSQVMEYLVPPNGGEGDVLVDCTLGEGGHTFAFLNEYPKLRAIGLDADAQIQEIARQRLAPFSDRATLVNTWFDGYFRDYPMGGERPSLILFDLGISVFHYEKGGRGFSFRKDESLDMRLGEYLEVSAADIVNTYPETELADILYRYGEERYSRRIARKVVDYRRGREIKTTGELGDIIWNAVPPNYRHGRIHPATRSFQALRIAVNGELARIERALPLALRTLKPGGYLGVISFHSLEDRIVKWFFKEKNKSCTCDENQPICNCGGTPVVEILTKKPVLPTPEEVDENPPSRSAKLRVVRKLKDEEIVL